MSLEIKRKLNHVRIAMNNRLPHSNNHTNSKQLILIGPTLETSITHDTLKKLHLENTPQIAIDGGIQFAHNPILWMGDGDSGSPTLSMPALRKSTQDETDLRFCLNHIQDWSWEKLHLFGFLGKRKDHELANLGEVYSVAKSRTKMEKAIFYNNSFTPEIFIFPAGKCSLPIHGLFSILTFEQSTVTVSGQCEFKAHETIFTTLEGRGLSNRGFGLVQIQSSAPFLILT